MNVRVVVVVGVGGGGAASPQLMVGADGVANADDDLVSFFVDE